MAGSSAALYILPQAERNYKLQVILAKLVNNNQDVLAIEVSKVNTQSGTFDCGIKWHCIFC